MKKRSIFIKFLGCFMAVWIPFSLTTISLLLYSSNRLAEETLKNSEETLFFFSSLLNDEFDRIIRLLYTVSGDMDIQQYAAGTNQTYDYSQYLLFSNAQQKLRSYSQTGIYIYDMFLITPNGSEINANYSTFDLDKEDRKQMQSLALNTDFHYTKKNMLICFYKDANGILIGAKISMRDILDTLRTYMKRSSYGCLLLDSQTGGLIGHNLTDKTDQSIFEAVSDLDAVPEMITVDHVTYLISKIDTQQNYFSILSYVPRHAIYVGADSLKISFILLIVCAVLIPGLIAIIFKWHVNRPLSEIVMAMGKLETGDYDFHLAEDTSSEFGYVFRAFNNLSRKLKELIEEVWQKKVEVQQAQYRQLQEHINPHFLFNSLYIGYRMAKSGNPERMPEVAQLCMYLGDYFRYITYLPNDMAELQKEVEFMNTFLSINKIRFSERMSFSIFMEAETQNLWIPTLMIQPLVENAVKHGVEKSQKPCRIQIKAHRTEECLQISVEDDGGQATAELIAELSEHITSSSSPQNAYGLWNVQRRLRTLNLSSGLHFELSEQGNFRVSFSVPILKKPENFENPEELDTTQKGESDV